MPKPKPLVSTDPNPNPKDVMFRHFGVLDDGKRSKGAAITSISLNVGVALVIVVLGMIVKTNPAIAKKLAVLTLAPKPIPPKPPPPKPPPPPPPKPLPKPPDIKLEPPKIKPPELLKPLPPEIKPVVVPVPKPVVLAPPAPKLVNPPPAPKMVSMAKPAPASIANNDAHPSPVRLGNPELKALSGKPVGPTPVNMAGGMHNMPPSNAGSGPPGRVSFGSGAPSGTDLKGKDNAPAKIAGIRNGVPGGTGTGAGGPRSVQIAAAPPPPPIHTAPPPAAAAPPKLALVYKPKPAYSPEAASMHLEGTVTYKVRIKKDGTVDVLSLLHGLGHGLDEKAREALSQTRFKPPVDGSGNPMEVDTSLGVIFQMS